MSVIRYRKKPVVVDARKWDGQDIDGMLAWVTELGWPEQTGHEEGLGNPGFGYVPALGMLDIPNPDGTLEAAPGFWVVRDPLTGHYYPCSPDIFDATYEAVVE